MVLLGARLGFAELAGFVYGVYCWGVQTAGHRYHVFTDPPMAVLASW
jgi:hypothetical protein